MLWAIGHRTGTSKTAMAVPSINVPKIRRMIATTKQNNIEFRFIATTVSTSAWEAPEKVNTQENAVEEAMMKGSLRSSLQNPLRSGSVP